LRDNSARKIFIGCKTVKIVHNRESVDVRRLPSLYLGRLDTGIGKVYLYALFAPGTDVGGRIESCSRNLMIFVREQDFPVALLKLRIFQVHPSIL